MGKRLGARPAAGRRAAGWLLSALLVLGYYSPQAELLRTLPDTLVVARGQCAEIDAAFPLMVTQSDVSASADAGQRLADAAAARAGEQNGGRAERQALNIGNAVNSGMSGVMGSAGESSVTSESGSGGANDDNDSTTTNGRGGSNPSTGNGSSSGSNGSAANVGNDDAPANNGSATIGSGSRKATATVSLFGLLPLREVEIDIRDDLRLYPGGQAVGVALHTEGVLVVGTSDLTGANSPARLAGIKAGDLITEADGKALESTAQLTSMVGAGRALPLTVRRGQSTLKLTLQPQRDGQSGAYRIGAWVRDSTAGVGTLSFYGETQAGKGLRYGALGHAITDADTQSLLTVSHGEIMRSDVVDVRKGAVGVPGELKGSFLREHRVLGDIKLNNQYGIYGALDAIIPHPLYPDGLPIGRRDAVRKGAATILSTVGPEGMREYDVEIVEVARQSAPAQRSMVLRVTDEALLSRTGGIVQGMSGSPILQDGRLIGAVTHVFVNDPTMGYGLFIEWMLAQ